MKNDKLKLTINRDWTRIMNEKHRKFDNNNVMIIIYYVSYIKTQDETLPYNVYFDLLGVVMVIWQR